MTYFVAKQ